MAERIYTAEEIQDLTDRVFQLRELLEAGKMHFADHLVDDFRQSWAAVRLRDDGLVEPESVDGGIRSATMAVRAMKYREEGKASVSLLEIQDTYFKLLFRELGWLYKEMQARSASPANAAQVFSKNPDFVKKTRKVFLPS
ncbi:hypothetical protein [Cupriavidus plantarum]|uniref:hypothetical protein n=1 Tax=Cupriavidus plantarum TaxID=942865 RepID=UPI00339DA299